MSKSEAPLKGHHVAVLQALLELEQYKGHWWIHTFRCIRDQIQNPPETAEIRRIVRFLKRRGFAEYSTAMEEDGYYVAGSGHRITDAGKTYLETLQKVS